MESKKNFFITQRNRILDSTKILRRTTLKEQNHNAYTNIEDTIIYEAVSKGASDIHFEPRNDNVIVRIRINGDLINFCIVSKEAYPYLLSRIKVLSNMDMAEKRKSQDGSFTKNILGGEINFRVSTLLLNTGEKLALRIIYLNKYFKSYYELNFSDLQKKKVQKIINASSGLALIVGPTGSGKTQTLYSIVNSIKNNPINITSLEDPVEIKLNGINQVDLSKQSTVKFNTALKTLVRQDSDVIVIGEIRDNESAKIAAEASLTSHKIYSTMHAANAYEVFLRFKEMGIDNYITNSCVVGIICQRLVKILCDDCKVRYFPCSDKIDDINKKDNKYNHRGNIKYYAKNGCKKCNNTGYSRRELVSAVYTFKKSIDEKLLCTQNIEKLKGNFEMKRQLDVLLSKGMIDFNDYNIFLENE